MRRELHFLQREKGMPNDRALDIARVAALYETRAYREKTMMIEMNGYSAVATEKSNVVKSK